MGAIFADRCIVMKVVKLATGVCTVVCGGTCTTPKFAKPNRKGCDRYKVMEGFSWKGRVAG